MVDNADFFDGFTDPRPFTPDVRSAAPETSAVHVLRAADGTVVYVGETTNLRQRLQNHLSGGSVLRDQVLTELDPTTETLHDAFARFTISWRELDDPAALKTRLVEHLQPRYNRRGRRGSTTWWVNQGRAYSDESRLGVVFAGLGGNAVTHHRDVSRMATGDTVVHYCRGHVVALGEVVVDPVQARRPYGPVAERDHGWLTRVEYFELAEGLPLASLPERSSVGGPFDKNGAVKQGYLFPLDDTYAATLRSATGWPPGSPWSEGERKFWLFQANPKQWNLAAKLPDLPPGHVEDWTITRYRGEMRPGDGVVLWASGTEGGLHVVGRLTSEPKKGPAPGFRPEAAGPEEYRVDLRVVQRITPHITRAVTRTTPELADLAVLKLANATNFRVTLQQWRAVHALVPLGDDPETTDWGPFLHWARRFVETVDLDGEERDYKVAAADLLVAARSALVGGDWQTPLLAAFRATNALGWRIPDHVRKWLASDAGSVRAALDALWSSGDVEAAVARFADHVPSKTITHPGTSAALASFLLGALDVARYPVYRLTALQKAYARVRWPHDNSPEPAARYVEALRFLDEFRDRFDAENDPGFRDRLDAQGVLWRVLSGEAPRAWSQEEKDAYARFAGGGDVEDLTDLVTRFREDRGYPTDVDVQRGVEREELAVALTPEALADLDVSVLNRLAGPVYGSPGPQPGFNTLLRTEDGRAQVARTLHHLLHGPGEVVTRLEDCLNGDHKLPKVGEAVMTKALAVAQPGTWFPGYVSNGKAGKLTVLELLGRPDSREGSPAEIAVRTNDTIRRLLAPHFPDDPWGVQAFSWWLLHREHVPESSLAVLADELHLTEEFLAESVELLEDKGQVVFYGPPGTGKTFVARKLAGHVARGGGVVEKVQFHPSYAYEDFIEGYRPRLSDGGQVTYEVVDGPLKLIAAQATERPDVTHVLLIDELNRGNVAKILGELLFLLEYRDEEIRLQYSETPFSLPTNLKIIATMNTADRSIALVDTALRRRFHFVPFFPDTPPIDGVLRRWLIDQAPELLWVADVVDRANAELTDRNLAIGPSHFLRPGLTEKAVERAWRYSVLPFLEEHFYGDPTVLERFALHRLRAGG